MDVGDNNESEPTMVNEWIYHQSSVIISFCTLES